MKRWVFTVELIPDPNADDKDIDVLRKRVRKTVHIELGALYEPRKPYAIRCVIWHPLKIVAHWAWKNRCRIHEAIVKGICEGSTIPEHCIAAVLFSWRPDEGQPRLLADIQRLEWETSKIAIPDLGKMTSKPT